MLSSEKYATVDEVAKAYGVSKETVRRWCRDGIIKGAIHARRDWRIPKQYASGTIDLSDQGNGGGEKSGRDE